MNKRTIDSTLSGLGCLFWLIMAIVLLGGTPAEAQSLMRHGDVISITGDQVEVKMIPPYRVRTGTEGYIFTTNIINKQLRRVRAANIRVVGQRSASGGDVVLCQVVDRFRPLTSDYWFGAVFNEMDREAQPGTVIVQTTPAGASVLINGQKRGITPMRVDLAPGVYTAQIRLYGYRSEERTVRVVDGGLETLNIFLRTTRSVEEGRSGDFYLQKGMVMYETGDYDRALLYLERAVQLMPDNGHARDLLEKTLAVTNRRAVVTPDSTAPAVPGAPLPAATPASVRVDTVVKIVEVPAPASERPPPAAATKTPASVMADAAPARSQPPPGWTGKPPDGLESWRRSARERMARNDLAGAEVYVRNILDWNPNDTEARSWMGRIIGPAPVVTHKDDQMQVIQLPGGQEIKMARIPGGTFDMGDTWGEGDADEKPVHPITLFDYWIGMHEVTNQQFAIFLNAWGNQFEESAYWLDINDEDSQIELKEGKYAPKEGFADRPVVEVTWYGAKAFAQWIGGRLPTEAEWEYAARNGGRNIKYPSGGTLTSNDANLSGTNGKDQWEPASPVGSFSPNALGLYDMAGNVWEWCQDWYAREYYSNSRGTNPEGPPYGDAKVLRGGSWYDTAKLCRVSYRNMNRPTESRVNIGFRVVMPIK
jgi:formylglycine-generating enzyme required for sulfatase activity